MATVVSVEIRRGIAQVLTDAGEKLQIRQKHFLLRPLQPGDCLETESYLDAIAALQSKEAFEAALCALDISARTRNELAKILSRKGYVLPAVEAVLARLTEIGLIDDRRYAQRQVELAIDRPVGAYSLKRKLRGKGISEEDLSMALDPLDEQQQLSAAQRAVGALRRRYEKLPPREARQKLSQALARRGFGWDTIAQAVEGVFPEEDWE